MKKFIDKDQVILVAGARGMVGSALVRCLKAHGYNHLLAPTRSDLDLTEQQAVRDYFKEHQPSCVIIAAAKVGGIYANMTYPADFIYENLMIECNLIHGAHNAGINRLLFLGSTCIYPREAPQPIREEALLSAPLEKTNEAYALAKIAGVKMCQFYRQQYGRSYISAMPTNLYGPGDNYHSENAHVIPALIRRFHEAKVSQEPEVAIWGTGLAQREFLYVEDLALACLLLLERYDEPSPINVGSSEEFTIRQLSEIVAEVVGYSGRLVNDLSKPDGTPRKKSDLTRITSLGWAPLTPLSEGIKRSYLDFIRN